MLHTTTSSFCVQRRKSDTKQFCTVSRSHWVAWLNALLLRRCICAQSDSAASAPDLCPPSNRPRANMPHCKAAIIDTECKPPRLSYCPTVQQYQIFMCKSLSHLRGLDKMRAELPGESPKLKLRHTCMRACTCTHNILTNLRWHVNSCQVCPGLAFMPAIGA